MTTVIESLLGERVMLRRRFNERRRGQSADCGLPLTFVCECGEPDCHLTVPMEAAEFDAIRPARVLHSTHLAGFYTASASEPLRNVNAA